MGLQERSGLMRNVFRWTFAIVMALAMGIGAPLDPRPEKAAPCASCCPMDGLAADAAPDCCPPAAPSPCPQRAPSPTPASSLPSWIFATAEEQAAVSKAPRAESPRTLDLGLAEAPRRLGSLRFGANTPPGASRRQALLSVLRI